MTAPAPAPERHMSVYAADYIWWYHATGPVEVSINGGEFLATEQGVDPKAKPGYRLYCVGPLSSRTGAILLRGENILVSRVEGDPQSALVTTFRCE